VDYTLAENLGAFLSEPVCHCGDNCFAYWTRALILDKGNRLVELNTTKTQFHQFHGTVFKHTVCNVSEHQPDSNEIHLVERVRKLDLYQDMLETLKHVTRRMKCQEIFYQVWKHKYPHLKIPKNYYLGKCDYCAKLMVDMTGGRGQTLQNLLAKKKKHTVDIGKERKLMDTLIDRAKPDPENWTCLATN
jgi:hypothetical protein